MLRFARAVRQGRQDAGRACVRCDASCANAADSSRLAEPATNDKNQDAALSGGDAELLRGILRVDLVAQTASAALFAGHACARGGAPDVQGFRDSEQAQLRFVQQLAPQHRVRPSLIAPLASAAFGALGAAAAFAPKSVASAVAAGVQDALTDTYTEQLRELRERGVADAVPGVRRVLRALRDQQRAPDGAAQAPDILALQRLGELTPEEWVAGAVKGGVRLMLGAARHL